MKKIVIFMFISLILLSATAFGAYSGMEIHNSMERAFSWLDDNASPLGDGDSVASDYYVTAMSRANRTFDYNKYVKITKSKKIGTLDDAHRIIISNAACDGVFNETFIADYTYNANLSSTSDIAGALLSVFGGRYDVKSDSITADDIAVKLMSRQAMNGSFDGNVLTTCESIIALSFLEGKRYEAKGEYKTETYYYDVNNAILRGVNFLQSVRGVEGDFGSIKNTAYAIMALDSAGVDSDNDPGFLVDGKSPLGWLLSRQLEDGSFGEGYEDTAMAVCALVSHIRAMQGKADFFDVRSLDRTDNPDVYTEEINLSGTGLESDDSEPVKVVLTSEERATEAATEAAIEDIIGKEIREVEKNMEKTEQSKLQPVIIFVISITLVAAAVTFFILWRIGIRPKLLMRIIKKSNRDSEDDINA